MDKVHSKFKTMGTSAATTAANRSGEAVSAGKLIPKKHGKSVDPYKQPVGRRSNVKKTPGRTYGISSSMAAYKDPTIAPVQSNGRIFNSAVNRVEPNFKSGHADLN